MPLSFMDNDLSIDFQYSQSTSFEPTLVCKRVNLNCDHRSRGSEIQNTHCNFNYHFHNLKQDCIATGEAS